MTLKFKYLIGIGNETMTDDGVGPRVAEALGGEARVLGYEAVAIGHDSLGIISYFEENTERILFVDCARMGKQPGDWVCFSPADVETRKALYGLTTHEGDLLRIIEMAEHLGCPIPRITVLGIEPHSVQPGLDLSPTLKARWHDYLSAARTQMKERV